MSIRIVPEEQLAAQSKKLTAAVSIPPLLFANLQSLYSRRAERLRQLAVDHPLGDYLNFAAVIAEAQQSARQDNPLTLDLSEVLVRAVDSGKPPLDTTLYPRDAHWHRLLASLIAALRPRAPGHIQPVLDTLENASVAELEQWAQALLDRNFVNVGSDKAPFLWAALSLYWVQMANLLPGRSRAEYGEQRQFCPVCGSIPVSSVVQLGTINGLRYLHCNLCESEWHVVRVKCSNCEQADSLNYWSLDSEQAAVKAESCTQCGSYLKILYQDKDTQVEAVADDLASLILDAKMEDEGFARSSINPFLFPSQ